MKYRRSSRSEKRYVRTISSNGVRFRTSQVTKNSWLSATISCSLSQGELVGGRGAILGALQNLPQTEPHELTDQIDPLQ